MDADFLETNGTITLDGDSWSFGDTLEAMEAYAESEGLEEPTYPYRAHFVAVGPAADNRGPTIRYSRDGEEWGTIHAPGEAELFSVAANDAGNLVAVGADRWWGIPDGRGYIYYSDRGETWELVKTLDTGLGLYRVVYAQNQWVAVGNGGALYYSADGRSWNAGDTGTTRFLHAVGYGGGVWMVAGGNGLWAQASEIDGSWTIGSATVTDESDPMAMPMEPSIRGVVYDSSSTHGWTAVAYALEKTILLDLNQNTMEAEEVTAFADELGSLVQGEPQRYIRWSDGGTTHHYILCRTDGAPRLLSKSAASWVSEQFATTGSAHLADIAGGPSTAGGPPRLLLISASGDAWLSYDRGGSWTQVLADSYGTHGATYRSW